MTRIYVLKFPETFSFVFVSQSEILETLSQLRDIVSDAVFRRWLKNYEEDGLEGLARADSQAPNVLPEGFDRTEESYKREIMRLRIENERLKKLYSSDERNWGTGVHSRRLVQ